MEIFTHVQKVYTETDNNTYNLDIPLAIFMIKLLSIKVDFSNFKYENKFKEYMESDKPLKLRYYLQIKFKEELTEATEIAKQEMDKETKYIKDCFRSPRDRRDRNPIPVYEKRIELYDKYLKDITFDEDIQNKISEWIKPDMVNGSINYGMRGLINMEMIKKYGRDPENFKNIIIAFMNKFSDKESVEKLLYSMRDVYILGLL